MCKIQITELGRKWYGVTVYFDEAEIETLTPDILRGLGGKLRYDNDGGLRALFHFNVTNKENSSQMIQVLKHFGEDGFFENGLKLTNRTTEVASESTATIQQVNANLQRHCLQWAEQWKDIAITAIHKKQSRIEVLREINRLGLTHITENKIRSFIEEKLFLKYTSDLFVETFMWRLGWPDKRKPMIGFSRNIPLPSRFNSVG